MDNQELQSIIESILFVADEPVSLNEFKSITKVKALQITEVLEQIKENLSGRGFNLIEKDKTYQLVSNPQNSEVIAKFFNEELRRDLSQAALEILSIISYKQPVTRVEVDKIRGVHSGGSIRNLAIRGLIEEVGRKDGPGRPILYGTTINFLKHLGLSSPDELPKLEEIENQESDNKPIQTLENEPQENLKTST
ncbi:SMC-Scp complex subunit ScpB [Patescibacteria group bacterium]